MLQKNKPYILVFPALIVVIILLFGGVLEGFFQSMKATYIGGVKGFTLKFYKSILMSNEFWDCFFLTIRISIISTLLSSFLGILIIFCLFCIRSKTKKDKTVLLQRIFQIPMLFPYLVAAYLVFFMFVQSGFISRILFYMGFIKEMSDFPVLVNDEFGFGIIIAYVWKTSPFIVLMLYPVLLRVEDSWIEVGRVFGANRFKFFKEVVFPLLINPAKTAIYIVFSYTAIAFEIPFLLGVTYPKSLSVYAYQIYMNGDLIDRPKAMAINIILTMIVIIIGVIFYASGIKNYGRGKDNG